MTACELNQYRPDTDNSVLYVIDKVEGGGASKIIIRVAKMLQYCSKPMLTTMVKSSGYSNFDTSGIDVIASEVEIGGGPFLKVCRIVKNIHLLSRIIKENDVRCVVSFLERSNVCSIVAGRLLGVRVVVSVRNNIDRQYGGLGASALWAIKKLLSFAYRRADFVVALSKGVENQLIRDLNIDSDKICTIYNPYNIDEYRNPGSKDSPRESSSFFLAVGRLEHQKGFDHLIKAFALYRDIGGTKNLKILGDGSLSKELTELIAFYRLEDRVLLQGYRKDVIRYMQRACAFVFSSRWEGFGNALVEAVLCGTPVISVDCQYGPAEILDCQANSYPTKCKLGYLIEPFSEAFDRSISNSCQEAQLARVMAEFNPADFSESSFLRRAAEFSSSNVERKWKDIIIGEVCCKSGVGNSRGS